MLKKVTNWFNECVKYDGKTIWVCSYCAPINAVIQLLTPLEFRKARKDERSCVVPKGGICLIEWRDRVILKS